MRKILALFILLYTAGAVAEQAKTLNIGVNHFSPPFIMRSGGNGYYGFDIGMMNYICRKINRECKYYSMPFNELLISVEGGKVDAVLSALTITKQRAQFVNFSNPYLISYSRFLGSSDYKDEKFTKKFFIDKVIGIKKGSIFIDEIRELKLRKVTIKQYLRDNEMIDALSQGKVDLVFTDNETAVYWQNHSSGQFAALGNSIKYGLGYGIAVNKKDKDLIAEINRAIRMYHNSTHFSTNYMTYIATFPGA